MRKAGESECVALLFKMQPHKPDPVETVQKLRVFRNNSKTMHTHRGVLSAGSVGFGFA